MKVTEVIYNMAEPASKLDIIKYLFTNGRYGKVFIKKPTAFNEYSANPPYHLNCRSTHTPIDRTGE